MTGLLFSVIIPTYHRPDQLLQMVQHLSLQTYQNWELIIVDDSVTSAQGKINEVNNSVRYFHRGKKLGVSSARNYGAQKASGKYIIFIDDDDQVTDTWLEDYAMLAEENNFPDLLFCGMEIIDSYSKKRNQYYPSKELWRFVFPGAWAITRKFFFELDGYDERLLYGENTELFFKIRDTKAMQAMTDAINFYYAPSLDGGSKNEKNKIDSTRIVLEKHKEYFSRNRSVERLLTQVIGVSLLRLGNFAEARKSLLRAYLLNPFKLDTLLRLIIAYVPMLSKRVYKLK